MTDTSAIAARERVAMSLATFDTAIVAAAYDVDHDRGMVTSRPPREPCERYTYSSYLEFVDSARQCAHAQHVLEAPIDTVEMAVVVVEGRRIGERGARMHVVVIGNGRGVMRRCGASPDTAWKHMSADAVAAVETNVAKISHSQFLMLSENPMYLLTIATAREVRSVAFMTSWFIEMTREQCACDSSELEYTNSIARLIDAVKYE